MESAGYRLTDSIGREIVYAGLLMVEQDFSKLGEFYEMLVTGNWQRQQIVPSKYVGASVSPDGSYVHPND